MSDLLTDCRARTDDMVALLTTLIGYETPTRDKAAVDRLGDYLAGRLADLGAAVERYPLESAGDMILAKWNSDAPGKPITFIAHMDTVWPLGTLAARPVRIEDGKLYGPGSVDMKGGIAILLSIFEVLQARGEFPDRPVWVLLTSDEELGSKHSEGLIKKVALASGLCLIMEPPTAEGELKTWRKGIANFKVKTVGRASHAGGAPEAGINAVVELAHQTVALHKMNDLRNGTSVSVTVVHGGITDNVIPDAAEASVDVRFLTQEAADRVVEDIRGLRPVLPGAEVIVEGGVSRPPMERDAQMQRTFAQIKRIGESIGLAVYEGGSGGGSDGNFTAALGVPTLDGLGSGGTGLHALDEHVVISSLAEKTALLAALLQQWTM